MNLARNEKKLTEGVQHHWSHCGSTVDQYGINRGGACIRVEGPFRGGPYRQFLVSPEALGL